jgi:two-component system chemotaxis sensor kinase CheA
MDDLLTDFLTETNESLAELDDALLKLEQTPDDADTLSQIFRLVHTIKGTCGFLGLPRLERVAHAGENVLGRVRDKVLTVTPGIVTSILSALDRIKLILGGLAATGKEPAGDDTALIEALNAIAEGRQLPEPAAANAVLPAAAASIPGPDDVDHVIAAAAAPSRSEPQAAGEAHIGSQTIRVDVDVLEDLMTLVSELVLTRNQLLQLARSTDGKTAREMDGFSVPLQRLSHITSDLQEGVMKTRMQPIGNAWNKLPRLVRDLGHELDKKIDLVMHGAETELDRQVLELIKDPLTHMVRNSADHGLETAAERRAVGKPELGRITLNAFHEGGHIIIEIADDGRGLPVERIRAKALSRGIATEADLAAMTETQIQRFIFHAGFSTAAEVTAISGRGVGMDVVKTNIERIGGTIELNSRPGRGTCFMIKIPLTLAIVSALVVEAGGERFAIPQSSVVELVRAQRDGGGDAGSNQIELINGTPVLRLRDRLLPLINLNDLLQLGAAVENPAPDDGKVENGAPYVVVTQVGASILGIIVDRVFDTEEIVVKPVAPILRHMTMFSGNTILGDGSVIMILDPNGIARASGIVGGSEARHKQAEAAQTASLTDERVAMLLFRAGRPDRLAVPLSLVARLEDIPRDKIESSSGKPVTQYRARLMPLVPLSGAIDPDRASISVLVFNDTDRGMARDRCMGLVVDEIVDVVEDKLEIQLSGARPGLLGTAVIAGRATDVIDIGYWLTQAHQDWFEGPASGAREQSRVLVVEDSDFFRQMLAPMLSAAGYSVTAVGEAAHALRLRDGGVMFDVIVSDIEMPGMDGLAFVQAVRDDGPWQHLPVIALSGRSGAFDSDVARDAGFTDFVQKFEREGLLVSLQQCLAQQVAAHAVHHRALAA